MSIKLPRLANIASRKDRGDEAENLALRYLRKAGLKPVSRNYHCRGGEIDLIMRDGDTLVFVEVRYRKNRHYGGAAASITPRKQQRIIVAAQHYLLSLNEEPACRFDVVAIDEGEDIQWIQNAFGV